MAIDTSIQNTTVEGPLFPTTPPNVFPIPKTGPHNLANTWKRQVEPLSKVISHLLEKPLGLPKKKKNHRGFKKEARSITQQISGERTLRSQTICTLAPILNKHAGFISSFAKQRYGIVRFTLPPISSRSPNLQELLGLCLK